MTIERQEYYMNDILILITSAFPFQKGEEFLPQETAYYTVFKKVYIIPIGAKDFSNEKNISKDITVYRLQTVASSNPMRKLAGCATAYFGSDARKEIRILKESGRYSLASLRQALVDSYKVASVKDEILGIVAEIRQKHEDDNLILYSYWMGIHAKMATEIKKVFPEIKIVTRCHGGDLYEYRYKTNYIPFRKTIFENEDTIFTISENGKEYLKETYKTKMPPIIVSRLGTNQQNKRTAISNEDGLSIVSCSYCIPLKRVELIIKALSGIKENGISWTHIGNGSEFENLMQLAADTIPDNVHYEFLGYVPNSKVQELYSTGRYNLFVNVSETEGIPVSIMEAMSYGMTVIATDVGGVSEMLEEGGNGFLLPKDFDTEQLRNYIINLLHMSSQAYSSMSEKSHEIWEDKFHAEKNYTEFIKMLKEL